MSQVQIENALAPPGRKTIGDLKISASGLANVDFCDLFDTECRLAESSIKDAIWVGTTKPYVPTLSTMHLSREMVAELLPRLQAFVENGRIVIDDDKEERSPAAPGQD